VFAHGSSPSLPRHPIPLCQLQDNGASIASGAATPRSAAAAATAAAGGLSPADLEEAMAKGPEAADYATDSLEAYEALRPYMIALVVGGVISGVASLILSMEFLFECLLGVPASALSIIVGGVHIGHWVKGSRTAGVAQILRGMAGLAALLFTVVLVYMCVQTARATEKEVLTSCLLAVFWLAGQLAVVCVVIIKLTVALQVMQPGCSGPGFS